jgi:uncharacterized Zn finger protein
MTRQPSSPDANWRGGPGGSANPRATHLPQRRSDGPRRVRQGIKLAALEPLFVRTPFAKTWLNSIHERLGDEAMTAGLEYARAGQIVSIDLTPGSISARVQGSAAQPYQSVVGLPTLSPDQWFNVIALMEQEALYSAKLLANELPAGIDELFSRAAATMLPALRDIRCQCTCPAGTSAKASPETLSCKHVAAAAHVAAQRLAESPLLIFTLLGMPVEQVLQQLRRQRAIRTQGLAAAHVEVNIPESHLTPQPLEMHIDEFWRSGPELAQLENLPPAQHAPHALLRRLGPSPLSGRFPMVGLLASVYDAVAATVMRFRD